MEIVFVMDGNEKAYVRYDPILQRTISFRKSGEKQEIPDAIAEQLLKDFPRMFGRSLDEVKNVRGTKEEILLKKETNIIVPFVEEVKTHPMAKSFQKVEKSIKKTEGRFEKVDKKPIRKLGKKGK